MFTTCFRQRRCLSSSRAPRLPIKFVRAPPFMPDSASSTTSFPQQIADRGRSTLPTPPPLPAASAGRWAAWRSRLAFPASAVDAAASANKSVSIDLQLRRRALRGHPAGRANLSAGRQPQHLPHRHAQDPVLLPVQSRHRAADRRARQPARRLCGHARTARALSGAAQRLPERLRRMLRALPLRSSRSISDLATSTSSTPAPTAITPACRPSTRSNGAA